MMKDLPKFNGISDLIDFIGFIMSYILDPKFHGEELYMTLKYIPTRVQVSKFVSKCAFKGIIGLTNLLLECVNCCINK